MSEICREDAIEIIDTMRFCFDYSCDKCDKDCDSTIWAKEAYTKAISDMEKLEKIEQRIAEFQNGTDMFNGMDEAYVVYAIEQIVKGEK